MPRSARWMLLLPLLGLCAGCSLLLDFDAKCTTDSDCPADQSCVDNICLVVAPGGEVDATGRDGAEVAGPDSPE